MNKLKFTLLEMLIAMLLLSILTVGILSTYGTLNKNWIMATASNEVFYDLLHVEQVLDNAIPNAIPFVWKDIDKDRQPRSTFAGKDNQVSFCYLHPLNDTKEGAIRFMHLLVEDDQLVAYYKNRPWVDIEDLNEPSLSHVVISSDVKSIAFKYADYDSSTEEIVWNEEWENELDTTDERYYIPLAIQTTIEWLDGRAETFLYRTAG
ncbi:MAG: type II secretion system protein, partial [Lentisphaeria bacterium]|nr:type II secretion system protein [Lentisphaeria bacterium]